MIPTYQRATITSKYPFLPKTSRLLRACEQTVKLGEHNGEKWLTHETVHEINANDKGGKHHLPGVYSTSTDQQIDEGQ